MNLSSYYQIENMYKKEKKEQKKRKLYETPYWLNITRDIKEIAPWHGINGTAISVTADQLSIRNLLLGPHYLTCPSPLCAVYCFL